MRLAEGGYGRTLRVRRLVYLGPGRPLSRTSCACLGAIIALQAAGEMGCRRAELLWSTVLRCRCRWDAHFPSTCAYCMYAGPTKWPRSHLPPASSMPYAGPATSDLRRSFWCTTEGRMALRRASEEIVSIPNPRRQVVRLAMAPRLPSAMHCHLWRCIHPFMQASSSSLSLEPPFRRL